ncbi:outer membrane protein [Rhodobacter sp. NSM]|uniref:outer membrane protein n=1 Tax=Rhodobacter sp. NSM TaxID=3457501 RepID=UPI003FD1FFA5
MRSALLSIVTAMICAIAAGAEAGGLSNAQAEPEIIAPASRPDWSGTYVGGTVGRAFGADDRLGFWETGGGYAGDVGDLDVSGTVASVRLGYRWQLGSWVMGPELSYEAGSVSAESRGVLGGESLTGRSEIGSLIALRLRTGYAVRPDLVLFGQVGLAQADIDYSVNGFDGDYKATGYLGGIGIEKSLGAGWSVTGEVEYLDLGKELRRFGDLETNATPTHSRARIGLNYQF